MGRPRQESLIFGGNTLFLPMMRYAVAPLAA